jgi:predicted O-methyltransferase YrrM
MNIESSFDRLCRVSAAFQETSLLAAAAELDVFTVILEHNNRLSAQELAEICQTDLRGMTVLLDTLAATEYLHKKSVHSANSEAIYSVAEEFRVLLDRQNPETFIPMIRHMSCVQRSWTELARTIKNGTPFETSPSILGADEDRVSFIWAMNSVAQAQVEPTVLSLKKAGLLKFNHFIDIGGASGTYALAFLEALPKSQGTIFDLPVGIAAARQRFTGTKYENRIRLVEGDFYRDELPSGFDFAWISAIIHQFDRNESRQLYEKAFNSLHSGGKVAVRDFMMNAERTAPKDGAFFGMSMLAETKTGRVYTFDEVKTDLESVGFTKVKLAIPTETMSAVVTAQKT